MVLLPPEAGKGSDRSPKPVLPPALIPPSLKKDYNTNGVKSKLEPDANAGGDHSALKRDKGGKITGTATYDKKKGKLIPAPHIKEGKGVRPAKKEELPNQ